MKARKLLVFGAATFGAGVLLLVLQTLVAGGTFTSIEPHGNQRCEVLEGFSGGTEDFAVRHDRTLFVSSPDFRDADAQGRIYLVDTNKKTVRDITPELEFSFQPHGVGLWHDADTERLFVVNHRDGSALPDLAGADEAQVEHTIEIFDVADDGTLSHATTVRGAALVSPNDVTAVGPNAFYATNDHGYTEGVMRMLEEYLRLPLGTVVYGEDGEVSVAWEGTRYGNGIAVSPELDTIYVAETTGFQIRRFRRDAATGALELDTTFDVGTAVDNINVDSAGNLWTGAHPKLFDFVAHSEDAEELSPSQVLFIKPRPGDDWEMEEILLDDGSLMSGSSVAWTNGYQVVVGAVFQHKLLLCPR